MAKKIILSIIAVLVLAVVFKDALIVSLINSVGSSVLGAPVKVGSFHWGFFSQKIRIKDLKVGNPAGFPEQALIDVPEVSIDYNIQSLLQRKLHFPYINLHVKETVIVRNKEGSLNVEALKIAKKKDQTPPPKQSDQEKKKQGDLPLTIDLMKLNIERTVYMDYSKGEEPVTKVFDLGLKERTFKNITSIHHLVSVILIQGMAPAAIKSVAIGTAADLINTAIKPAGTVMGVFQAIDQKLKGR